jgi:hypothetical protein
MRLECFRESTFQNMYLSSTANHTPCAPAHTPLHPSQTAFNMPPPLPPPMPSPSAPPSAPAATGSSKALHAHVMYVYVCMYVCVYMYVRVHGYLCICMYIRRLCVHILNVYDVYAYLASRQNPTISITSRLDNVYVYIYT